MFPNKFKIIKSFLIDTLITKQISIRFFPQSVLLVLVLRNYRKKRKLSLDHQNIIQPYN